MPLPDSAALSLQVNANAVQSRPKHAMVVRMSAETLDALDAFPNQMSFDFGGSPGIHIGDAFFPMRPQKEGSPHEIFLRVASAAKPMAPLKLYANVVGKFMVERQLGDRVTDRVRQQTMVARQQHMERQAILLDQPPIHLSGTKNGKRKTPGSGTVLKKLPPAEQARLASSSAPASRKLSPLPQASPSAKANSDVRRRLVQFLAVSPRLAEDAVKMVGGANIAETSRQNLLALLDQVAEQVPAKKGDKSPRSWQLKPQTWTEVRPYEWKLSEAERRDMARQARMTFSALKIPDSDPVWDNVRHRPMVPASVPAAPPMAPSTSSRSSVSAQAETKRSGITTKEAKSKSKQDAPRVKGEIHMKDESAKAPVPRVSAIKRAEIERPPSPSEGSTSAKSAASRRLPGSGYQKKTSLPPTTERSATPVDGRPAPKALPASLPTKSSPSASQARKTIPTMPSKPTKKEDQSDRERDREYERQKEREREKREKREREREKQREERERERAETEKREKAKHKEREDIEREKRKREKEREREEVELEKRKREKERVQKERAIGGAPPAVQRKTAQATDDVLDDASSKASPAPKRRKLDDGTSVPLSSLAARDPGPAGGKKAVQESSPVPRLKMKKDRLSPQLSASSQDQRATSPVGPSTHKSERPSKSSGATKPRRRSPIYTSSEDEGEIPQPRKRNPSPPPVSDQSNSSDQPSVERAPRHHRTPRAAYPSPDDRDALRAMYNSYYTNYLGTLSKVVTQRHKLEAVLKGDSDAEVDLMDPDELAKLSMEHRTLKSELERIQDIYTKGTIAASGRGGSGSTSD